MKRGMVLIGVMGLILGSGCAQKADTIKATYVSPLTYSKYSCSQLKNEVIRVNKRLSVISGEQAKVADKDAVTMGVGVLLFPPALLFMAAGDDQKAEIGNLKGQWDTLRDVSAKKNCAFAAGMR